MATLTRRLEALERTAGLGRYDDGPCICQPPNQVWEVRQTESVFSGMKLADEPLPDPGWCERGLKESTSDRDLSGLGTDSQ